MIRVQGVVRFGVGVVPGPRDGAGRGGVDRWHQGAANASRGEPCRAVAAGAGLEDVDEATAVDARQDAEFGDAVGDELPAPLAGRSGRGADPVRR